MANFPSSTDPTDPSRLPAIPSHRTPESPTPQPMPESLTFPSLTRSRDRALLPVQSNPSSSPLLQAIFASNLPLQRSDSGGPSPSPLVSTQAPMLARPASPASPALKRAKQAEVPSAHQATEKQESQPSSLQSASSVSSSEAAPSEYEQWLQSVKWVQLSFDSTPITVDPIFAFLEEKAPLQTITSINCWRFAFISLVARGKIDKKDFLAFFSIYTNKARYPTQEQFDNAIFMLFSRKDLQGTIAREDWEQFRVTQLLAYCENPQSQSFRFSNGKFQLCKDDIIIIDTDDQKIHTVLMQDEQYALSLGWHEPGVEGQPVKRVSLAEIIQKYRTDTTLRNKSASFFISHLFST